MKANRSLPILQCHGEMDPVVAPEFGLLTNSVLKKFGFTNCTMKSYSGLGHSSSNQVRLLALHLVLVYSLVFKPYQPSFLVVRRSRG